MKPGLRTYKSASLRVAVSEALPEHMHARTRELISIHSTDQGKGHASALVRKVCREADRKNIALIVQPRAFSVGMGDDELAAWYLGLGFVVFQRPCEHFPLLMARMPARH